jgi:hypothetical protein
VQFVDAPAGDPTDFKLHNYSQIVNDSQDDSIIGIVVESFEQPHSFIV